MAQPLLFCQYHFRGKATTRGANDSAKKRKTMKLKSRLLPGLCLGLLVAANSLEACSQTARPEYGANAITLADPTIFLDGDTYYLYGTSSPDGILVYSSDDLEHWSGPCGARDGHALMKGDSWGTMGFWAPQVFSRNGKYYMAYTANEQIAIAESDSPLGPFTQDSIAHIPAEMKQIDPFVFFDDNGKAYLYHVRLLEGNRIYVAELNDDMKGISEITAIECISAEPGGWEDTANAEWRVAEGPTVVKYAEGARPLYYLFYSCNDFRNPDYAVGYATAPTPRGPWTRNEDNPVMSRKNLGYNGTGHGDIFTDKAGKLHYVLHTHSGPSQVQKRKTAVVDLIFDGNTYTADPATLRFLEASAP